MFVAVVVFVAFFDLDEIVISRWKDEDLTLVKSKIVEAIQKKPTFQTASSARALLVGLEAVFFRETVISRLTVRNLPI